MIALLSKLLVNGHTRPRGFVALLSAILAIAAYPIAHAQTGPNLNYEGETVTGIELASRPESDVEFLRSLIVQQPGQPYSNAKVQQSVAALMGTGEFSGVKVQT